MKFTKIRRQRLFNVDVVYHEQSGRCCVYLNDYRIAGPKIAPYGRFILRQQVTRDELYHQALEGKPHPMNPTVAEFIRKQIKEGLTLLPEKSQILFKRMYSHKDPDKPIDAIIDAMPTDQLDWALTQVQNSLKKQTP